MTTMTEAPQYTVDIEEAAVIDFALTLAEDLAGKPGADVPSIYNATLVKLLQEGLDAGEIPAARFPLLAAEQESRRGEDDCDTEEETGIMDALIAMAEEILSSPNRDDIAIARALQGTLAEATFINLSRVGKEHPHLNAALKASARAYRLENRRPSAGPTA